MCRESLQKAVDLASGQAPLARGIRDRIPGSKVSQVHVWGWLHSVQMEVPPAEAVIPICETIHWQMTPHELRPDLYPNRYDGIPPNQIIKAA